MQDKEKNFEHVSLYLYDRELMEELKKDFETRGFDSKSKYITSLIKSGLRKEQKKRAIVVDAISVKLDETNEKLEELQSKVFQMQAENEVYQKLLCNIYHLLERLFYGEDLSFERLERGQFDGLPPRHEETLQAVREEFGIA